MEPIGKPLVLLTEDIIKQAAVGFLKTHYKYRPRSGDTKVQIDMRGEGGIVADGMLSFLKEDGLSFSATVEATARETKEEVFYRTQSTLLIWDAMAFSLLMTAVMIVWTDYEGLYAIHTDGILWRILSMIACMVLSYFAYRLLLKNRFRYHYIYAIEQFKLYHADEQWIAIGHDVFGPNEEKFKDELRAQCVFNGFGLLMINPDRSARLMASPAKKEVFSFNRKIIKFIQLNDLRTRFRKSGYTNWLSRFNGNLKDWISPRIAETLRFKRNYYHQQTLSILSICIISGMLYLEWTKRPVAFVDELLYSGQMERAQAEMEEESDAFIIDAPVIPFEKEGTLSDPLAEEDTAPEDLHLQERGEIILTTNNGRDLIYYDCERFFQNTMDQYLLIYKLCDDLNAAANGIKALNQMEVDGGAIWEGCFSASEKYYVFVEEMMTDSLIAASRAQHYEDNYNIYLSVKKIIPAFPNKNN
ncbi:MAG: hypothetical protein R2828_31170 [Saprospiraceae bacterium]